MHQLYRHYHIEVSVVLLLAEGFQAGRLRLAMSFAVRVAVSSSRIQCSFVHYWGRTDND